MMCWKIREAWTREVMLRTRYMGGQDSRWVVVDYKYGTVNKDILMSAEADFLTLSCERLMLERIENEEVRKNTNTD